MSFKVLIVDDHRIMREGLRAMLEKEPDIKVVGDAADGRMAQLLARDLAPDVIIMDVNMPELNGIEATRQITAELREVKIIALSMHEDRRFVLNMLKAGAAGYMLKDDAFKNLAKAVRMVAAHKTYLSREICRPLGKRLPVIVHLFGICRFSVALLPRTGSPSTGYRRQDFQSNS